MNVLRRVAAQALRNPQMRGGAGGRTNPGGEIQWPNGSFWSEGTQEGKRHGYAP